MFQIVRISPIYCQITDGQIGTQSVRLPMTYHTEEWARCLAARLGREDYEHGGDDIFRVVRADTPIRFPLYRAVPTGVESFDDLPF